jgi:hypothetical protein
MSDGGSQGLDLSESTVTAGSPTDWVACGEHKQPLANYLAVRSFLKRVEP